MGIDDESRHPELRSAVADGVTRIIVCLFREPDAGNLPVRFDEREQETEPSQTGLRRRRESVVNSHREAKATAPVLDSTRHITQSPRKKRMKKRKLVIQALDCELPQADQ
jgi:hypothetical protein